ncbi:MAG: uracil-DNA glycosylase [Rickettsiales bacterium]|jgi:DNA polymerase|nr:uracil-DNA glycosylase [Rickettsiales bacterium]
MSLLLYSLRDLALSAINWELKEESAFAAPPPEKNNSHKSRQKEKPAHAPASVPAAAPVSLSAAQDAAGGADSLQNLSDAIINFNHPLKQFAQNVVPPHFAKTPGQDKLLIITDMPSADDDDSGQILTGAGGELMDKMLAAINLSRDTVSIMPLVFWRSPGGRTPTREELDLTKPFLEKALSLANPKAILTLGTLAAIEIAGARLPKDHGACLQNMDFCKFIIPIFHPNYLLLKPDSKKDVWSALQKLAAFLETC